MHGPWVCRLASPHGHGCLTLTLKQCFSLTFILALIITLVVGEYNQKSASTNINQNQVSNLASSSSSLPQPFNSSRNKVLGMILSYSFYRFDPLLLIFKEYRTMCNAGWDPTVVIFTAAESSDQMRRYIDSKMYCHRIQAPVKVVLERRGNDIGRMLADETRRYLSREWQKYDLVIYQEEDIIVEYNHVMGYLAETERLHRLLGQQQPEKGHGGGGGGGSAMVKGGVPGHDSTEGAADVNSYNEIFQRYTIGFQRQRRHMRPFEKNKLPMTEEQIFVQEYLEEIPFFRPVCLENEPYLHVQGDKKVPPANVYQAMWMLTKQQIEVLQRKCGFLDQSLRNSASSGYTLEYMGSLSLLDNDLIGPHCGVQKLIPADQFSAFTLWHFYHSTDPLLLRRSNPVFYTAEHIAAGMLQSNNPKSPAGYFDGLPCWEQIVQQSRLQQNISFPSAVLDVSSAVFASASTTKSEAPTPESIGQPIAFADFEGKTYILENGYKRQITSVAKTEVQRVLSHYGVKAVINGKHLMYDALPPGQPL